MNNVMRHVTLEPSPFTPLLSLAADFEQKKPFSVLNLRGTNPSRPILSLGSMSEFKLAN
jgi:hypothetical protein